MENAPADLIAGPSPYASSSSESSETSSESSALEIDSVVEEEEAVVDDVPDDEDAGTGKCIRSAHEVEVIECPEVPSLEPGVQISLAGVVQSVVGNLVVVKAASTLALNIGTVICLEETRDVVGIVEEVRRFFLFIFFYFFLRF